MAEPLQKLIASRYAGRNVPVALVLPDGGRVALSESPEVEIVARTWSGLKALASPAMGALARAYVRNDIDFSGSARRMLGVAESLVGDIAHNIIADIEGTEKKAHRSSYHGFMVSIGGRWGVAHVLGISLTGIFAMGSKHMINVIHLFQLAGVSAVWRIRSIDPIRPLSGVRSSWLVLARNSLLARLAASAASLAARVCASWETSAALFSATADSSPALTRSASSGSTSNGTGRAERPHSAGLSRSTPTMRWPGCITPIC